MLNGLSHHHLNGKRRLTNGTSPTNGSLLHPTLNNSPQNLSPNHLQSQQHLLTTTTPTTATTTPQHLQVTQITLTATNTSGFCTAPTSTGNGRSSSI